MKKLFYIIAIVAMMSTAVQGYAQGREGRGRGHRTEQRAPQSRSGNRGSQPQSRGGNSNRGSQPQSRGSQNHGSYSRGGHNAPQNRNHGHYTPPRHNNHGHHHHTPAPPPRHNHYRHHHHHCYFTDWCWYTWNGYANRYRYYRNCYWDSYLGYYIYGSMSAPTRIDIGGLSLARYGNNLKIQNGTSVSYMDLWLSQTVSYSYNNTSIVITTGGGRANIQFYDAYGNSASYRL